MQGENDNPNDELDGEQLGDGNAFAEADTFAQPATSAFVEKRRFIRHKVRWRALVLVAGGAKLPVHVVDISEGGLSLVSSHPLVPNSRQTLAVFLPDAATLGKYLVSNTTVKVLYQVLRGSEFLLGAEFLDPSPVFLDRVHAAVQRGFLG